MECQSVRRRFPARAAYALRLVGVAIVDDVAGAVAGLVARGAAGGRPPGGRRRIIDDHVSSSDPGRPGGPGDVLALEGRIA